MLARLGDGVTDAPVAKISGDERTAACRRDRVEQPHIGGLGAPEGDDMRTAGFGVADHAFGPFAVCGNNGDAAFDKAGEDLRLLVRDSLKTAEVFDMRGRDGGDQRNMGAGMGGERGDLALVVHPHLEHAELGPRWHPRKAERNADMVVVAAHRPMRRTAAGAVEAGKDRLLHAGLADRSGDPDPHRFDSAIARGMGERMERSGGILDEHVRKIDRTVDDGRNRALGKGRLDEAVAVHCLAFQGHEQIARFHIAGVHLDASRLKVMAGNTAGGRFDFGRAPEGKRQRVAGGDRPLVQHRVSDGHVHQHCPPAHSRATSTSSKASIRIVSPDPNI